MVCPNPECRAELRDSDRYCPQCGRIAVGVTCLHESPQLLAIGKPPKIRLALQVESTPAWKQPVPVRVESPASPPAFQQVSLRLNPGSTHHQELEPRNLVEGKVGAVKVRIATVSALPGDWGVRQDHTADYSISVSWADRRLDVQPAIAVFRHPEDRRLIEIRPGGDHAVYVRADAPTGDMGHVPPSTDTPVTSDHPAIMTLTCTTEEPGWIGEAAVETSDGAWSAIIPGYLLPPTPPRRKPATVVAVDFGTSSTSVAMRSLVTNGPIVPLGPAKRFPSFVFLPSATSKTGWKFGDEARQAYDEAVNRGRTDFVFVRNLKTLLREEAAGASGTLVFDPEELLEAFFRWLLQRHIVPALPDDDGAAADVAFVFTIPVLDNGDLKEAQERATLEAARRAGFERYGSLTTVLEPEAAARELLRGRELRELRVALIDSGAGTTDLTFCRAVPENGHFALKDICSVSARATEAFRKRQLWEEQFGGEALTKLIAVRRVRRLMRDRTKEGQSEVAARREAARWFVQQLAKFDASLDADTVEDVLHVIDPEEAYFPDTPDAWHNPRSRFHKDALMFGLEEAKRAFAAGQELANPIFEAWGLTVEDYQVASELLAGFLEKSFEDVDSAWVDGPFDVIAAVGGNGGNPDLRKAFLECVGTYTPEEARRLVELDEPLLATVRGACRIYDDPAEAYPFGIRLTLTSDDGSKNALLEVREGETMRRIERKAFLNANKATLAAEARIGGEWIPLGKPLVVSSPQTQPRVVATLGPGVASVRVEPVTDGNSEPLASKTWKLP